MFSDYGPLTFIKITKKKKRKKMRSKNKMKIQF
jgi:hypothetical protein